MATRRLFVTCSKTFAQSVIGLLFVSLLASPGRSQERVLVVESVDHVPSARPSGNATNDQIWFNYFRPRQSDMAHPVRCIIVLHGLDIRGVRGKPNELTVPFARYFAEHGIASVAIDLPYHGRRIAPGDNPTHHFLAMEPETI